MGPWPVAGKRTSEIANHKSGIRTVNCSTFDPSTPAPRSLHIFLILHPPPDTCIIDRFGAPRSSRFSSSFGRGWQAPERARRPAKRMTQDSGPRTRIIIVCIVSGVWGVPRARARTRFARPWRSCDWLHTLCDVGCGASRDAHHIGGRLIGYREERSARGALGLLLVRIRIKELPFHLLLIGLHVGNAAVLED